MINNLEEIIDKEKLKLLKFDKEYICIFNEIKKIKEKYPKIKKLFEDEMISEFSIEECKMLNQILTFKEKLSMIEEREIFFLGMKKAYEY